MQNSSFGEWIKERRRQLDLTQSELAERVGCSLETVQKLESSKRRPSKQMVEAFVRQLGLTGDESAHIMALARLTPAGQQVGEQPTDTHAGTNLPKLLTSFVGREREVAELKALVGSNRLVTLTGPGGSGKTRLAVAVAEGIAPFFGDGVYFADLAGVSDPHLVPQALGSALNLREEPGSNLTATMQAHLEKRRVLLLLDNCEHLIEVCAFLADRLLHASEGLHMLATSRRPLALSYELTWAVSPLGLPHVRKVPPVAELADYPAISLFVQRAAQRLPGFALTTVNAPAALELCRRLDGMPLAIELAAARVRVLPVEQIVKRLDERFELLTAHESDVPARQRTLRSTIDWSYHLLSEAERDFFNRLSVFAESFTLEASRAVCAPGMREYEAIDVLAGLVDKSFVVARTQDGPEPRYHLLETLRQYGQEQLEEAGAFAATRDRHLDYYLSLAEKAAPRLKGPEQLEWLDRLEGEIENLRAALGWGVVLAGSGAGASAGAGAVPGAGEKGLRLAVALSWFWHVRSYLSEGRYWLEGLLASTRDLDNPSLRAAALHAVGVLAWIQYDIEPGLAAMQESMQISESANDKYGIARASSGLSMLTDFGGDVAAARMWNRRALAAFSELGSLWDVSWALTGSGIMSMYADDYASAVVQFEENIDIYRQLGDEWAAAVPTTYLGLALRHQGKYAEARRAFEEARDIYRKFGDQRRVLWVLVSLGDVALAQDDRAQASAYYMEALSGFSELGTRRFELRALHGAAHLAKRQGKPETAARLLAAHGALNPDLSAVPSVPGVPEWDSAEEEFPKAWREGANMSIDQAIALALEVLSLGQQC